MIQGRLWIGWEGNRRTEQMVLYAGNGTLQKNDLFFIQYTGSLSTQFQEVQ